MRAFVRWGESVALLEPERQLAFVFQRQQHHAVWAMGIQQDVRLDDEFPQLRCATPCGQGNGARSDGLTLSRLRLEKSGRPAGSRIPTQVLAGFLQLSEQRGVAGVGTRAVLLNEELLGRPHVAYEGLCGLDTRIDRQSH
jgi:hypothetical protein